MSLASYWALDPNITFLNHGSFGACPRPILEVQSRLRSQMEAEPVRFFNRELEPLLDKARSALGSFLDAKADDLAFVPNATHGINAVLRSLRFAPGDELLTTDHVYNACRNALHHVAETWGARVVIAEVPFPLQAVDQVVGAVLERVSSRTRLALLDHVTSPTGLVFPIARLVRELDQRGVDTLVDGAHAPGMLPLRISDVGAAYYTGNLHKWVCAPKGAAFLHVREDRQERIRPLAISHGMNSPRPERTRFRQEFDWTGTDDFTAFLCVPEALGFVGGLVDGGWPQVMQQNRSLALAASSRLAELLEVDMPCPEEMVGSLAALPLPKGSSEGPRSPFYQDPLQDQLLLRHHIEVPIVPWPAPPNRWVRVSAQLYNHLEQYERLGHALRSLLAS